jgi:predicted phosphodiesterase
MARFRIFSDLHSEFHRDRGNSFVATLPEVACDAVILAGDIGDSRTTLPFLEKLCARFRDVPVLYVSGNHEHYHSSIPEVRATLTEAATKEPFRNLVYLDNTVVEVAGVRVAGTTLWFPDDPLNVVYQHRVSDFRLIRDLRHTVYEENRRAQAFIASVKADVVVTHHLPCDAAVAPQWCGSALNRFFVGGDDALVAASRTKMWIFGHTHNPMDFEHMGVRFVANPFGYPFESKSEYRDDLLVTV